MAEIDPLILKLDELITVSRLNGLAVMLGMERAVRMAKMAAVLGRLPEGAYLLGTGPSTVGIIPLTVDEVVLGRSATLPEKPAETVIDYAVNDTLYFTPHEVSKTHAKVVRREGRFFVQDLESTCGTFVNRDRVGPTDEGTQLSHGDVLSLGPSRVSTYVFYQAGSGDEHSPLTPYDGGANG